MNLGANLALNFYACYVNNEFEYKLKIVFYKAVYIVVTDIYAYFY